MSRVDDARYGTFREPVELFAAVRAVESDERMLPRDPVCRMAVDPERAPPAGLFYLGHGLLLLLPSSAPPTSRVIPSTSTADRRGLGAPSVREFAPAKRKSARAYVDQRRRAPGHGVNGPWARRTARAVAAHVLSRRFVRVVGSARLRVFADHVLAPSP